MLSHSIGLINSHIIKQSSSSITTDNIDVGSITNDKLAPGSITNDKLANSSITGNKLDISLGITSYTLEQINKTQPYSTLNRFFIGRIILIADYGLLYVITNINDTKQLSLATVTAQPMHGNTSLNQSLNLFFNK